MMSEPLKTKRRYQSTKRTQQAANTQRKIVQAARELFLTKGYTTTTITEIAAAAGTSPETIYATYGSKAAILSRLVDMSLVGNYQAIPELDRDWVEAIRNQSIQRVRLRMLVRLTCSILEHVAPLHALMRAAAVSDPEIASLRIAQQEQRLVGQTEFVRILAEVGALRADMSVEKAGEMYWLMASPELHTLLTREHGWTGEQYESWLFQSLELQLLPSP